MRQILFVGLTALVMGCLSEEPMTAPYQVPVEHVVLPDSATVERASSLQLDAVLLDAANNVLESRNIIFTSQDERIATVDARGLITGVAEGRTTITASIEGRTAQMALVVLPARPCEKLSVWDYC